MTAIAPPAPWQQAWQYCQARRWRLPLWCSGDRHVTSTATMAILSQLPAGSELGWLGAPLPEAVPRQTNLTQLSGQARQQVLGRQFDWLVVNTQDGIDWDLVAASIGCVKAGGVWLLLTSAAADFANSANPQAKKVLSYPTDAQQHIGGFAAFVIDTLQQQVVFHLAAGADNLASAGYWCQPPAEPAADARHSPPLPYASTDQQQAVAAIHQVVKGHRNRPLVLTAHRGRGKSAALGIAASELAAAGKSRLIITAPQPAAAAVALQHANQQTAAALQFWPVDRLLAERPLADLLLIDEAAAIPTPQLQALATHYSRVVFATTEHGYEGTGRGFQLRFAQYLQQHKPGWQQLRLQQPVRYGHNDPLEQLSFALFLLAAELPAPLSPHPTALKLQWQPARELASQPQLLQQVMALATLAHYQTSVRDLWALFDDPALWLLLAVDQHAQLAGMLLVSQEGALETSLCQQIAAGVRRVQGHLAVQNLLYQLQFIRAGEIPSWRVQRIITTPAWQRQGVGRQLLTHLQQQARQANIPMLSTSFGVTAPLLLFWQQAGFVPVRLSDHANQRSNEHSVLLLCGLTEHWQAQIDRLHQAFQHQLGWQICHNYQKLDPELLLLLAPIPPQVPFTAVLLQQVRWFAWQQRPLADSLVALNAFFCQHWQQFPPAAQPHWVSLCWQRRPLAQQSVSLDWFRQSVQAILALTHPDLSRL